MSLWGITQSHRSFLMLKLLCTKSDVKLLKVSFLACLDWMDQLALHRPIQDLGRWILKKIQSFWSANRKSQKIHPTFKIGFDTRQANTLYLKVFLKKDQTYCFQPPLRDFSDNYIVSFFSIARTPLKKYLKSSSHIATTVDIKCHVIYPLHSTTCYRPMMV